MVKEIEYLSYKMVLTVVKVMKTLPTQINTSPIPATIANKAVFLKIKKNASLQAMQKLLLVIAI